MSISKDQEATWPVVTVMITARNRPDELRRTLESLCHQDYPSLELLVIDDASDPECSLAPVVQGYYPEAIYLRNETNLGYIISRNAGMLRASGAFVLSLDDDSAPIRPDAIRIAVERAMADPGLGILTFHVHHGLRAPETLPAEPERYIHTFIGCGHMIRRPVIDQLGGYRDFFFYYGEEAEYSLRALDAGWRILYFPEVVVHHRVSDVGRSTGRVRGYSLRNYLWTIWLLLPLKWALLESAWKLFTNGLEVLRQLQLQWGMWAILSFARGMPSIWRLRRPIKPDTVRLYNLLRFRRVTSQQELATSPAPDAGDLWRWLWRDWRHRRRGRAFWDRRAGGVGRSQTGSFPTD